MTTPLYSISKTSFLKFEQCQKAFFLYKNHPYLRDKVSVDKRLTFKRGHDVGFFAQQLFPAGIDVSAQIKNSSEGIAITRSLIENKTPVIYEATFVHNGVLIMIDILVLNEGKYTAYEVKSSLKVSDNYIKDACLQYYVLKHNLHNIEDFFLVTLNPDYKLEGKPEPKKLFKKRSIKLKAEENFSFFEHRVSEAMAVLEQNVIPNIAVGRHCFRPYPCDYIGTCWKETLTEKSIFNLPVIDKNRIFDWHNSGIKNIEDLNDTHLEKPTFIKVKNAFVTGEPIIDLPKIEEFLARIKSPVAAMDMEIWNPAIPQIEGTKPFEQVPFLVCFSDVTGNSYFFTENKPDGRKEFAEKLIELSAAYNTILVYDKTMEVGIIDNLSKMFPEFQPGLSLLKSKFVDVFDIFLGLSYYHPDFQNNFSLKTASQFLLKDVSYSKITSGLEAMNYYDQYRLEQNIEEKENTKSDLVTYCQTDTVATLKLTEFLKTLFNAADASI
ncbi:MAG: DUF2779 domain-containing protein [Bacteroidota bacterium]